MTKIVFLGVGEAFDEKQANTSLLMINKTILLLDCGYAIPGRIWSYTTDPTFIDAIYISHTHSDHHFGLSPLLMRMWEDKRQKPLTIICRKEDKDIITTVMHLGHRDVIKRVSFLVNFIVVSETSELKLNEYTLTFAPTIHVVPNLAIKIKIEDKTVCYSGDGKITLASQQLFMNSELLVHDGYFYDTDSPGHPKMVEILAMAKANNIKRVAFTHINRLERRNNIDKIKAIVLKEPIQVIFPNLNDSVEL